MGDSYDGPQKPQQQQMMERPNGMFGEPQSTLELEKYLAEPSAMMEMETNTGQKVLVGDVPAAMKRKQFGMLGKQVINSYYSEKDQRVKKLQNFISSIHEEMWTPIKELNGDNGRGILDMEQARIYGNDLVSQGLYGMHSKQRTTITNISMAGNMNQMQGAQKTPANTYF